MEKIKEQRTQYKKIGTIGALVIALCIIVSGCVSSNDSGLSPARDLTGDWEGTCVYYELNMWGERDVKVTATCEMHLKQKGNAVTGVLDIYPTQYEDVGEEGYVQPIEGHSSIDGIISGTTLTFDISSLGSTKEQWEFTFTTDLLSGGVTNVDDNFYLGRDSDSHSFRLMRR